ncbi:MAG: 4Fe-4S binding protein [Deltaproteobacteria bacterium]|jgi:polyferredoxin|nr:4Fe-4S binding protein [Deltaproteobacteria bacterium]
MTENLLDLKIIGPIIRSSWTWRLVRLAMLVLLIMMIVFGWGQHALPGVAVKDPLMYTSLTTFSLWVVWMMAMVLIALIAGRSWCTICPVGWFNGIVSRYGLRQDLPSWAKNFVPVTLTLVLLQLLVYFFAIHRFPDYSSILLLSMLALAGMSGLIFRRRAFCLLFCPAGAVFALYARVAPWQLRVKSSHVCADCESKPCIATQPFSRKAILGNLHLNWQAKPEGCPVELVPAEIHDSSACTLCLNCAQTCCNDNIKIGFRAWFTDLVHGVLKPGESLFFLVVLGLLTANFSKVHVDLREAIFWIPERLTLAVGWEAAGFYPIAVAWIGFLFPMLILVPGFLVYLLGRIRIVDLDNQAGSESLNQVVEPPVFGKLGFWGLVSRMIQAMLPVILMAHLALAVVKLNAKLAYLPLVIQDPSGIKSFLAITVAQTIPAPGVILSLDVIKWMIVGFLLAGVVSSCWVAWRLSHQVLAKTKQTFFVAVLVNILLLSALYGATVYEWLFVR